MFRGANAINLDAKGRLAMPARYRDRLVELCGGQLVATIALEERCLWIYPMPAWEAVEAQLRKAPNLNPAVKLDKFELWSEDAWEATTAGYLEQEQSLGELPDVLQTLSL